jgi:hypothetical protein
LGLLRTAFEESSIFVVEALPNKVRLGSRQRPETQALSGGKAMLPTKSGPLAGAATLALLSYFAFANAAEVGICAIVVKPADFNHQTVTLQGVAAALKETTSHRGNDYTTFKLQDPSGCGSVSVFAWGHAAMNNGDQVRVEGVFETEHHQGRYTFYNEVEATKVTPAAR